MGHMVGSINIKTTKMGLMIDVINIEIYKMDYIISAINVEITDGDTPRDIICFTNIGQYK